MRHSSGHGQSSRIFYIIIGVCVLFYFGGRFIPMLIGLITGSLIGTLYYVAAILGLVGIVVMTGRWLLRRR